MPTPVKVWDSANKVMLRLMTDGTRNGAEDVLAEELTKTKTSRRDRLNNRQSRPISPAFFASSRVRDGNCLVLYSSSPRKQGSSVAACCGCGFPLTRE